MKLTFLKISVLILLVSLFGAGCEKDEGLFWEISPGSESSVIQKEVNGIEFKFCLLNEQGEPATVFKEGGNFMFKFSIKNNRDQSLPFYNYEYYESSDFCEVRTNGKSFGQPFIFKGDSQTMDLRWLRSGVTDEMVYSFIVPWHDERQAWQLHWGLFESKQQPLLPKGNYQTQFSHKFIFKMPNKESVFETDLITFKINFEIE